MKLIVPMAGQGLRFLNAGVKVPKPLVDVMGQSMLNWAMKSIQGMIPSQTIFIILKEHDREYGLANSLRAQYPGATVITLDEVTEGQLATVLTAKSHFDAEDILVANCDTYIVSNLAEDIRTRADDCTGIISVANMPGDRWSFARTDEMGRVVEVTEKVRISDHASTGLYYFSNGEQFVSVAEEIIANREKTKGEYYVIMVYQKYIERGWKVTISQASEMWDMGTPEALAKFEACHRSQ